MTALTLQWVDDAPLPTALNDPDEFDITRELLANADPAVISQDGDLLTVHLSDGDRRYRVVHRTIRGDWHVVRQQ